MPDILLGDLDAVFISYDEPGADSFYEGFCKVWPRLPKRVHGVKGFHAAHAEAARIATTERFVTVDGDSWPWDNLPEHVINDDGLSDVVFSFAGRNTTNGLVYGNGGVKVWPKRLLLEVPTHEGALATNGATDFCYTYRYWQVPETGADVIINQTPFQAFRAGYREGVKLMLHKGRRPRDWNEAMRVVARSNLSRLRVWCSVGDDAANGIYAIWGARLAVFDLWVRESIQPEVVQDYDWFTSYWQTMSLPNEEDTRQDAIDLGIMLGDLCGPMPLLDETMSQWFKKTYLNWPRQGLMIPEMEPPVAW